MIDRAAIRALAADHLREVGLVAPPFDHRASLRARRLELASASLEEILADSNLPKEARDKIDGFVDLAGRIVCLRSGLHPHQHRTGLLHEVAHDVIPWQREMLLHHYCSIFLPPELQQEFELEANRFAVECTFFGARFVELVGSYPHHLRSAITFAHEHVASYQATFRHFVECHPSACLLLVSEPVDSDLDTGEVVVEIRQYIKSPGSPLVIRPKQQFSSPEVSALISGIPGSDSMVEHELAVANHTSTQRFVAQSFWNSYKLFTLVWP